MLDAMDEIMKVDVDMCDEYGDTIPHEMTSVAMSAASVMGQGVSMMGLDLKSTQGNDVPAPGQGISMLGLDLGKKGDGNARGGVVVTADVIQPVTNMGSSGMSKDTETFRQQLIDAGFVRASQVLVGIPT